MYQRGYLFNPDRSEIVKDVEKDFLNISLGAKNAFYSDYNDLGALFSPEISFFNSIMARTS